MMKLKRTRARRSLIRAKRKKTSARTVSKPVKNYVAKAIFSKLESKRICIIDVFNKNDAVDGIGYYRLAPQQFITPGVTDRGRIGDSIYLSAITIRYVVDQYITTNANKPLYLHWYVVRMKSRFATPDDVWFQSFDAGATNTYVPLSQGAIQDGRRKLNTQAYTVLGHKAVKIHAGSGSSYAQCVTGKLTVPLKHQKAMFNTNSTTGSGLQEFSPGIYVIHYAYDGGSNNYSDQDWNQRFCIEMSYKD